MVLVNGFDVRGRTPRGTFALSSQANTPGVTSPDGMRRIEKFEAEPWPKWTFHLDDDIIVEQEIFVPKGAGAVAISGV